MTIKDFFFAFVFAENSKLFEAFLCLHSLFKLAFFLAIFAMFVEDL